VNLPCAPLALRPRIYLLNPLSPWADPRHTHPSSASVNPLYVCVPA